MNNQVQVIEEMTAGEVAVVQGAGIPRDVINDSASLRMIDEFMRAVTGHGLD